MPVDAFIDESGRDRRYFICVAIIDPAALAPARKRLSGLLLPGQRELHFKTEKPPRRRLLADRIAELPLATFIYETGRTPKTEEQDRQRCLEQVVHDLVELDAHRMVLDSRDHRDKHDRATIYRALGQKTDLTHTHLNSTSAPLLWIPDAVAWCYGAGGDWRRRVMPIVSKVIKVQTAQSP
ncbi:DUF3800 domain-containing protein [Amycolatopsis alkalitolerans]|uniref:DUF3800 domain-containing protein n=1 Tax=Amycolatopsis alkalitolerans TaxID=2547244 RepID=A0A5C4LR98_9PSEU|nr:DUF3800 domain-containing protein [Amycolatopsis alkalitolerans]TNC20820.1 DUF3800 domain-containing protein [Amycolatopsis alkalitolerans]